MRWPSALNTTVMHTRKMLRGRCACTAGVSDPVAVPVVRHAITGQIERRTETFQIKARGLGNDAEEGAGSVERAAR